MFHFDPANIQLQKLDFPDRIWKVRTDPFSDLLALELRNPETKEAAYVVVDWVAEAKPVVHAMDWWQGIEDFRDGVVLLHGYADHAVPVHAGLYARDAAGTALWELPQMRFEGMVAEGIVVTEPDAFSDAASLLAVVDGAVVRTWPDRLAPAVQEGIGAYEVRRTQDLGFPELVPVGDARYAEWCGRLGVTPFGAMHLQVREAQALVAWHEGTPEAGFALALAVFRGEDLLLDGWLEEGMTGMHPDPFFTVGERLVSIVGQRSLVGIDKNNFAKVE